jgi:hypothetical protein
LVALFLSQIVSLPTSIPEIACFGVFDGHNGDDTSAWLAAQLHSRLLNDVPALLANPTSAFKNTFLEADADVRALADAVAVFAFHVISLVVSLRLRACCRSCDHSCPPMHQARL